MPTELSDPESCRQTARIALEILGDVLTLTGHTGGNTRDLLNAARRGVDNDATWALLVDVLDELVALTRAMPGKTREAVRAAHQVVESDRLWHLVHQAGVELAARAERVEAAYDYLESHVRDLVATAAEHVGVHRLLLSPWPEAFHAGMLKALHRRNAA